MGVDDCAVVDLLAEGMKGTISETEARRTLQGYEAMLEALIPRSQG